MQDLANSLLAPQYFRHIVGAMDRFTEMEIFTAIVEEGGFTGAAKKLGLSKSAVSKHITALEGRLGASLLNRTTRQVSPTEVGHDFYTKSKQILKDTNGAEELVRSMQSEPQGTIRITAAMDFGVNQLADKFSRFLEAHPKIKIELSLENRFVDILSEGFDLAFRIGTLSDSTLKARKLAESQTYILASPEYIKNNGKPKTVEELSQHNLLHYTNTRGDNFWRLNDKNGQTHHIPAKSAFTVNDGATLLNAARSGLGLVQLPCFVYVDALKDGSLVKVLPDIQPVIMGVYCVYPAGDYTQPKIRALIDFMVEEFKGKGLENW